MSRCGLPHQDACPFCDQHEETINHLIVGRIFEREVWTKVYMALGSVEGVPTAGESIEERCTRNGHHGQQVKSMRAICLLVMWELWKHQNTIVFDGVTPCVMQVLRRIASECKVWKQAGVLRGELEAFLAVVVRWEDRE